MMKKAIIGLLFVFVGLQLSFAQNSATEQEIKDISKAKWQCGQTGLSVPR